jgi:hypothetical protein
MGVCTGVVGKLTKELIPLHAHPWLLIYAAYMGFHPSTSVFRTKGLRKPLTLPDLTGPIQNPLGSSGLPFDPTSETKMEFPSRSTPCSLRTTLVPDELRNYARSLMGTDVTYKAN